MKNGFRIFITGSADDLNEGHRTQAWLAVSDDPLAGKTGEYFYHQKVRAPNPKARDVATQDELLAQCQKLSGVALPR